ncbi:MAG: hypothetical protein ABIB97_03160 [Patescibacteria group bacterium]
MRKPMVYISATVVVVGIGVGGWYLFQNSQSETNTNTNQQTLAEYHDKLVYIKETIDDVTDSYDIYLADTNGSSELIHSFTNPPHLGSTMFLIYGDDQIFAFRYQDDETRKIINYDGTVMDTDLPLDYDFALSNDQYRVSYPAPDLIDNDSKLVIYDVQSGTGREYDAHMEGGFGVPGHLRPVAWSPDDSTVYADVVLYTEGCLDGLYEVNPITGATKAIPVFDELNICVPTVYPKRDLAFGFDRNLSPMGDEEIDVDITYYKVKLSDGTYSTLNLATPTYYGEFLLAPSQDLIAYADNDFNTWITDLSGENAVLATEGTPVAWSNNNLLAIDEDSITDDHEEVINIYDPVTQTVQEIVKTAGFDDRLEVIGWIRVPE